MLRGRELGRGLFLLSNTEYPGWHVPFTAVKMTAPGKDIASFEIASHTETKKTKKGSMLSAWELVVFSSSPPSYGCKRRSDFPWCKFYQHCRG